VWLPTQSESAAAKFELLIEPVCFLQGDNAQPASHFGEPAVARGIDDVPEVDASGSYGIDPQYVS